MILENEKQISEIEASEEFDSGKPRIIEIEFMGDEIGQFTWDGTKITMVTHTTDSFYKSLMQEIYSETGFFDFRKDAIVNNDATDDFEAFLIKAQSIAIKYGLSIEVLE